MSREVRVRLNVVILAVTNDVPRLLTLEGGGKGGALPADNLVPERDRTLELAVRRLVREQTGRELDYVEQLYTFGDLDRDPAARTLAIAYLALVREEVISGQSDHRWRDIYRLVPWEDWRQGEPAVLKTVIRPRAKAWSAQSSPKMERVDIALGAEEASWNPAGVLERYELLYDLGLVDERHRSRGEASSVTLKEPTLGDPLALDHRRMLATALGRLRGKLTYRPVVFELLPETFTLSQLQRVVEALMGRQLHSPNFRRLISSGGLVEPEHRTASKGVGRPAALFRFRRDVLRERPAPGVWHRTR